MSHFMVLNAVRRGGMVMHDTALGRRVVGMVEASRHFTGVLLELAPAPDIRSVQAHTPRPLRNLRWRIDGLWPALAQIVGVSVALQIAVFAAPFYLQLTVDEAIGSGDGDLMIVLTLGFGGLVAMQVGIAALRSWARSAARPSAACSRPLVTLNGRCSFPAGTLRARAHRRHEL